MKHPHIPRTWTAHEAITITDLLHGLIDTICEVYHAEIHAEHLARELEREWPEHAPDHPAPAPTDEPGPF